MPRPEPTDTEPDGRPPRRTLVVACGALVRELRAVVAADNLDHLDVQYLPAPLHNRPEKIAPAVREMILERADAVDRVLVGYADCGSGGHLDAAIEALRTELAIDIERLPGSHCYEFFTGIEAFAPLHQAELGTFFLTDYLARHFDQLIWRTMKFDRHPELIPMMFGNYTRVLYLAQTDDPSLRAELTEAAKHAADRLGLEFAVRDTGLGPFREALVSIDRARTA